MELQFFHQSFMGSPVPCHSIQNIGERLGKQKSGFHN